jgi:hypothetical protein
MRSMLVLALLLVAGSASAHEIACPSGGVDGQPVAASAGTQEKSGSVSSLSHRVFAHWLCCRHGVGSCTDFDTYKAGGPANRYVVSLEDIGTCTGVDISIGFRNDASGTNHTVGNLSLATTSLVIDGPRPRFVTATVNTMAGCGANADVRIDSEYDRSTAQP